jgi:hypothetical protein
LHTSEIACLDEMLLRSGEFAQLFLTVGQVHEGLGLPIEPYAFDEMQTGFFTFAELLQGITLLQLGSRGRRVHRIRRRHSARDHDAQRDERDFAGGQAIHVESGCRDRDVGVAAVRVGDCLGA